MAPNGDILVGSLIMIVCCHYQKTHIHVPSQSLGRHPGRFPENESMLLSFSEKVPYAPFLAVWERFKDMEIA